MMYIDQPSLKSEKVSNRAESEHSHARTVPNTANPSLVERLDPALGEATSGIGAMLTELVRRTLRGGVQKVDEELHSVVEEKIDDTISIRMPMIESAAHQAAEETARDVATSQVRVLEVETRATTERLAEEITESEQRAEARARELVSVEIDELKRKSKGTVDALTGHINKLHQHDKVLKKLVEEEISVRKTESKKIQENVLQLIRETRTMAEKALDERSMSLDLQMKKLTKHQSAVMDRKFRHLSDLNMALCARVAELEKPRGIKALWLKFFGPKENEAA